MQLLVFAAALLTAVWLDRLMEARGLLPPGFHLGEESGALQWVGLTRRVLGLAVLAIALWLGVFAPLAAIGTRRQIDPELLAAPQLFVLHALFAVVIVLWLAAGFLGAATRGMSWIAIWARQLGWRCRRPLMELGLGAIAGVLAWGVVILIMIGFASALWALGGERWLPESPPVMMEWIVGLPIWVRLAVACSAGVVEETFFRGLLQPRVGVLVSTCLFVLAHLSWGQPLMLVGVTILSLVFAGLVRWRQSIWAAVTAHAVFDAIQLLIVVPAVMKLGGE